MPHGFLCAQARLLSFFGACFLGVQVAVHRIALLFNANKIFGHEVIAGIAAYFGSTRTAWDIFLDEDFRLRLSGIEHWQGDGIIANFDDPAVAAALARCRVQVMAVDGSYADPATPVRGALRGDRQCQADRTGAPASDHCRPGTLRHVQRSRHRGKPLGAGAADCHKRDCSLSPLSRGTAMTRISMAAFPSCRRPVLLLRTAPPALADAASNQALK
jgi:hypothetical protein